jgi:hypothetical protein
MLKMSKLMTGISESGLDMALSLLVLTGLSSQVVMVLPKVV